MLRSAKDRIADSRYEGFFVGEYSAARDTIWYAFVVSLFGCNHGSPVYYRVYSAGGDVPSKKPADPDDPSLGRIKVDSIPPPRTVASMRRIISRVEKYPQFLPWHPKLFVNMFSESPMDDTHDPGLAFESSFSLDQPLAFVLPTIALLRTTSTIGTWRPSERKLTI
jgi:hypothetical protein